jgi:hypothetical protein
MTDNTRPTERGKTMYFLLKGITAKENRLSWSGVLIALRAVERPINRLAVKCKRNSHH